MVRFDTSATITGNGTSYAVASGCTLALAPGVSVELQSNTVAPESSSLGIAVMCTSGSSPRGQLA